jgi:hypothetical protein
MVKRGDGAAVAEVSLDGRPLASTQIGAEFRVNPGPHVVRATAADRKPFSSEFNLADSQHQVIAVVLQPRADATPLQATAPTEEPPPPPPPPSGSRPMKIAGFVVGGVGVVGLAVAGAFFGLRQKAISTLDSQCGPTRMSCPQNLLSTYNSGQRDATIATASFVAGLGSLALGGILIGVSTRSTTPKPAAGVIVIPGGAAVAGAF